MTYLVTEQCIKCKYMDCIEVCPVDCFHAGSNMVVIDPEACIDCSLCEPECPVEAIKADSEPGMLEWLAVNGQYAKLWPVIIKKGEPPADAKDWEGVSAKFAHYFDDRPDEAAARSRLLIST